MYDYRGLTIQQRQELLRQRRKKGYPPHSPPHTMRDQSVYLITASCFEHSCHMGPSNPGRRSEFLSLLFEKIIGQEIEILGWVILPNHYHLLVKVDEFETIGKTIRALHGVTACQWNRDEKAAGRKVWYRYSDRAIRSERHYFTTLNYIHYNPVKNRYVDDPYGWIESSVHWYRERFGRSWLQDLWRKYPLRSYGKGWDD